MGHDDFSTNEDFAAAVAQAQLAADVTSIEGTRVEDLDRETDPENLLGDASILGDAGIVGIGGLSVAETLARLAKTDPDMALDMMSNRSYRAGRGLLSGFTRTGSYSGYSLGQRMGESFDDYLERIYSDEHLAKESKKDRTAIEKTLKRLEKSTEKLESIDKEIAKNLDDLAKSSRRKTFDVLTPPGTTEEFLGDILPGTQSFEVETPSGTTDVFDTETGEWTALTDYVYPLNPLTEVVTEDEKTEEEKINSLIAQLSRPKVKEGQAWRKSAEDELKTALALEEETTDTPTYPFTSPITPEGALTGPATQEELNALIGTTQYEDGSIFQRLLAETLGLPVDMINAAISSILTAAGAPQHIIENPVGGRTWLMENKGMTIDDLVNEIGDMVSPTTAVQSAVSQFTPGISLTDTWPAIPSVQDTQANVVDEEYFPGAGMTAEESIERTRALNESNAIKAELELAAWKEYEANKQPLVQDENVTTQLMNQTWNVLDGLSQAMQDILNADPELMAQYMAARNDIMAQLNKTGYKEHEDYYPGSQAAATQAGYWGPLALGWNPKYNEYKDAQRTLMGLEAGQRFKSDDWIQTFGWMTPEQINRVSGYGNQ